MSEPTAASIQAANDRPLQGIAYALIAVGLFGVMDAVVKWLAQGYPVVQIVFFRNLIALLPVLLFIGWPKMEPGALVDGLKTARPLGHLWRVALGIAAQFSFFYSYSGLSLADVTAIAFSAPIFMAFLSIWMLGERVGWRRWLAILTGFCGVLVILRPGGNITSGDTTHFALVCLFATILYSLAMIQVRKLSRTETSGAIIFWFSFLGALFSGAALPFFWVTPDLSGWALFLALGIIGGVAQIFLTRAYALAPVAVIAPFDYTHMFWSIALGIVIFAQWPDAGMLLGATIVAASGLYILWRETRVRQAP